MQATAIRPIVFVYVCVCVCVSIGLTEHTDRGAPVSGSQIRSGQGRRIKAGKHTGRQGHVGLGVNGKGSATCKKGKRGFGVSCRKSQTHRQGQSVCLGSEMCTELGKHKARPRLGQSWD